MPIASFPAAKNQEFSALGFDYGLNRIGVAYGQSISGTATPLPVIRAHDGIPDWAVIQGLIAEWQPDLLVVGIPYHGTTNENEMLHRARKFTRRLHGRMHLPCYEIDETLSSVAAESIVNPRDRATLLDSTAASLILQSWFNEWRNKLAKSSPES